jgi:DNA repair exonuclease SbcCD nuclease subunit
MRLQLVSDLHLELVKNPFEVSFESILTPSAEILLLPGDIGNPFYDIFQDFMKWCSEKFERVFYVPGNHEYYNGKPMPKVLKQIFDVTFSLDNVHVLHNDSLSLDIGEDKLAFIGTTLWSYIPDDKIKLVEFVINDFYRIHEFTAERYNQLHSESVKYLREELQKYRGRKCIVITHHLPSYQCIHEKYGSCDYNCAFASSLEELMKHENLKLWAFGHSHASMSLTINGTHCISNPLGYSAFENPSYRRDKVIEV